MSYYLQYSTLFSNSLEPNGNFVYLLTGSKWTSPKGNPEKALLGSFGSHGTEYLVRASGCEQPDAHGAVVRPGIVPTPEIGKERKERSLVGK